MNTTESSLLLSSTNPITDSIYPLYAEGSPNARFAVVAQAPGRVEEIQQRPLVGPSGKLFKGLLREAGIREEECYFTNIAKERPPDDEWEKLQTPLSVFVPILQRELEALPNLKVIIPCGEPALEILTGQKGIAKRRGSIYPCTLVPGPICVPTYNPAYFLHSVKKEMKKVVGFKQVSVFDLKRAKEEADNPRPLPTYDFVLPTTADEVLEWLHKHEGEVSTVDTETYQNPLRISCLSIAVSSRDVLSIPFEKGNGESAWEVYDEAIILRALSHYLKNSPLIMQNCLYDLFVFHWVGIKVPPQNIVMDTMLAHHCCFAELPHGLDFLCSIYTRQPYYKDEGKSWHPSFSFSQLQNYCCLDSATTHEAAQEIQVDLKEEGLEEFYIQHYNKKIPSLLASELYGIPISLKVKQKIIAQHNFMLSAVQFQLNSRAGTELNVNSVVHMRKFLYSDLALPIKTNKKGNPTSDEKTIRKLAYMHADPALKHILWVRKVRKILSTYVNIPYDGDQRIRCQFNLMGTTSGRLSESSSPTGSGATLHNLPRGSLEFQYNPSSLDEEGQMDELGILHHQGDHRNKIILTAIKSMFVAPAGYVFIVPDYKQAEAYIVAYLAGEERLIEILTSGKDIHKEVASLIFKKPISEITKEERYLAKRTVHACIPGDHEVLTPAGWVRLDELQEGTKVAQWNERKEISFVVPKIHSYDYSGNIIQLSGTALEQVVTPEHRIPTIRSEYGPIRVVQADKLSVGRIPITGTLWDDPESSISPSFSLEIKTAKLAVAISADGHIMRQDLVEFNFAKMRKIERLILEIVGSTEELYSIRLEPNRDVYNLKVNLKQFPGIEKYIYLQDTPEGKIRTFKSTILTLPKKIRETILDEVIHWDGHIRPRNPGECYYCTTDKPNAVLIQTLAHITGRAAIIREVLRPEEGRKPMYYVHFSQKQYAGVKQLSQTIQEHIGKIWCLTVPSTFFLVRYKDTISITGNSNYGMGFFRFAELLTLEDVFLQPRETKFLLNSYHENFPRIRSHFQRDIEKQIMSSRLLVAPHGRKRYFFGPLNEETVKSGYSFIPQCMVSDMLNDAYSEIAEKYVLVGQQHDSLWALVPEYDFTNAIRFIYEKMDRPFEIKGRRVQIPIDFKYGPSLGDLRDWKDGEDMDGEWMEKTRRIAA